MGQGTNIAWTASEDGTPGHTFNPWWGCTKIAPECSGCYAEAFSKRTGGSWWGSLASRRFFGEKHWNEPRKWNESARRAGRRARVFCASMADVFEDRHELAIERNRLWDLIRETPALDWLLLTKRPENISRMLPALWGDGWLNVWLGTSVGCHERVSAAFDLVRIPAARRFLSMEPLIGPVVLPSPVLLGLDWIIVGGESGAKARPMDVEWARGLRDQAKRAGIWFFMKQMGGKTNHRAALEDLPEDLRIRDFPKETTP